MSGGLDVLSLREDDVTKMLVACTHLGKYHFYIIILCFHFVISPVLLYFRINAGTDNVDFQMEQYVYKRKADGIYIINLRKTWEKLLLAARAIVAIEHPSEVFVISSRFYGQRAVLKFAANTGIYKFYTRKFYTYICTCFYQSIFQIQ